MNSSTSIQEEGSGEGPRGYKDSRFFSSTGVQGKEGGRGEERLEEE